MPHSAGFPVKGKTNKQTNKQANPQPCEVFTLECIPELVKVNSNTAVGCGCCFPRPVDAATE